MQSSQSYASGAHQIVCEGWAERCHTLPEGIRGVDQPSRVAVDKFQIEKPAVRRQLHIKMRKRPPAGTRRRRPNS